MYRDELAFITVTLLHYTQREIDAGRQVRQAE
jgi:hypothetical protein